MTDRKEKLIEYYGGDELAASVLLDKYLLDNENMPSDMWQRLATEISEIETDHGVQRLYEEKFLELLKDFKFIPGGRIMYAVGRDEKVSTTNCYVIPIKEDSIEGIYEWLRESALTYRSTGGVGVDISVLRPKGTPVKNSGGSSPGACSFMDLMSRSTHTVHQKLRRGALIITMNVHHPDILEFINIKSSPGQVEYANISVVLTDEFMKAVENDEKYEQRWPMDSDKPKIKKKVSARKIWEEIIKNAHQHAEPGILFLDNHKRNDALAYVNPAITCNPCLPGDVKILTDKGEVTIRTLVEMFKKGLELPKIISFGEGKFDISRFKETNIINAQMTKENTNIIELELEDGKTLQLTPDHKVYTENRGYVKAAQLTEDDIIIEINV